MRRNPALGAVLIAAAIVAGALGGVFYVASLVL